MQQKHQDSLCSQGILWQTSNPIEADAPSRISLDSEKMQKYKDKAQSMFSYIREKCAPLHPSVFSAEILNNWECWYETQKLMFSDTDSFIINIALFQWPKPFRFRAEDIVLPEVLASELPDEPAGTQIIVHESEQYGAFTKADRTQHQRQHHLDVSATQDHEVVAGTACIYRWHDTKYSPQASAQL